LVESNLPGRTLQPFVVHRLEFRRRNIERGDHHIVIGEIVEAHVPRPIDGRPDLATVHMADLGDNVFYGD
jgi:hypothetical protein